MNGDETQPTDRLQSADWDAVPEGVDDLVTYVESVDAEVFVVSWQDGEDCRVTFAFDVAPVPSSASLDHESIVDVRSITDDPPIAQPISVPSIDAVRPLLDTETAMEALPDDPGNRAAVFGGLAEYDPSLIDVSVLLCLLDPERNDSSTIVDALQCLTTLVPARPDDCVAAIPRVNTLLVDSTGRAVRVGALTCLAAFAAAQPEEVAPHVENVVPALDTADSGLSSVATTCVSHVASADPEAVVDAADALFELVDEGDADADVRMHAAYALGRIAVVAPETIRPEVARLARLVDDETARAATRLNATCSIGRVAGQWPDAVVEYLSTFVAVLDDDNAGIRANAAGVVGDIAVSHAVAVQRHVTPLLECLADDDSVTRANGSTALARVAREFPEAVCDHVERLVDALDDEDPLVRENVCWTLGYLRDEAQTARPVLERVRTDDGDERVRGRAAWALGEVDTASGVGATD